MPLRVPFSWLKDFVPVRLAPRELAERLTLAGMEVEGLTAIGQDWDRDKVWVGELKSVQPHPNADRLCLASVEFGTGQPLTVVTGAPNLLRYRTEALPARPLKVALATAGADLIDGHASDGRRLKLKPSAIRGVRSEGMVCSEKELGLSQEHEGILLLPGDAPVGTPLADYLGDHVLEFDIKGGFAHLLCVFGIAREAAALTGAPLDRKVWAAGSTAKGTPRTAFVNLEIEDPAICARFTALLIEGVTPRPSPFWLQQRLIRAGMRPINAVVDATNYVMLELGQPLHAFDYGALRVPAGQKQPTILVRWARAGERLTTLDGAVRELDAQMVLVTDGAGPDSVPLSLAGVMGGLESEIKPGTTRVLLEAANWDFLITRRTAQVLKLKSEAGDRFGKRLSPEICLAACLRGAALIAELCGGRVVAEYADLYPKPVQRAPIILPLSFVTQLLGVEIPRAEVVRILEALEFKVESQDPLQVTPPGYRMDISLPADLVEEVARIHGYDRLQGTLFRDELPPRRANRLLDGTERVRDLLTGCGLDEIITYSLISPDDDDKLDPEWWAEEKSVQETLDEVRGTVTRHQIEYLRVRNPLDVSRAYLRRRLLAGALNTARANLRFGPRVAVFEAGAAFHPKAGSMLPEEPRLLCALLTGPRHPATWHASGADAAGEAPSSALFDFFDLKGVAETLLEGLEVEKVGWERAEHASYHPGRCATLIANGQPLGLVGELHPKVAAAFDITQPVAALELNLEALLAHWRENRPMRPLSTHPPIYEDLAFVVEEALPAERVQALILQTGRPLLRAVNLFDLFEGPQLGAGKKSLAFALTYQADDRTLTDGEVAKVRERIVKRVSQELSATLRA